jgi:putative endonuclease
VHPAAGTERRRLGLLAEDLAARHLAAQGMHIVVRNYRRRLGELDLVGVLAGVLVVVEVRTRTSDRFGGAAASIDGRKRLRIVRATQQLLQQHRELARLPVRFDVVVVRDPEAAVPRLEWLRGAFEAGG